MASADHDRVLDKAARLLPAFARAIEEETAIAGTGRAERTATVAPGPGPDVGVAGIALVLNAPALVAGHFELRAGAGAVPASEETITAAGVDPPNFHGPGASQCAGGLSSVTCRSLDMDAVPF